MLFAQHGPVPRGAQLNAALETLIGRMLEHQETSIFPILPDWRVHRQLYEEKSPKLYFYDLETSRGTKPGTKYHWVFSICMRDAARKTIIHTKISQGMTINQLYDATDVDGWEKVVYKWYGERSDDVTPGVEWHEIADIMEKAGVSRDCYSIEQSTNFFDHDNLYCNLEEIGRHLLVPQRKNVLRLIAAMRLAFKGFNLNHSLSMMHFLLFPEDRTLIENAHTEDADEEMLYKQAGLYFKGTRQKRRPSGIELYGTLGGKTQQDPDVQNEGDDLLAQDELIKDMKNVLADHDELEGSFEDEEEDLFRDELGFFDEELEDDGTLFEEMFANDDMIRGQNMPSTSLGDPKALPSNVPAIREASSIQKNVLEENNQMKLSEKVIPKTKTSGSSRSKASKTQGPKRDTAGRKTPTRSQPELSFKASGSLNSNQGDSKQAGGPIDQGQDLQSPAKALLISEDHSGVNTTSPKHPSKPLQMQA